MKLLLYLIFLICVSAQDAEITTVYLVRHAEKETTSIKNPGLTQAGKKRAQLLKEIMNKVELSAIYSTNFTRTIHTVKPIAETRNISISIYNPFKMDKMVKEIYNIHKGKSVLISGHSNTLSKTISDLGGEKIPDLRETEYSNLFILTLINKDNKIITKLQNLTY